MSSLHRYHRQMLLSGIGDSGQSRLSESHALIVGCGALGSVLADSLARAGVGILTIVDRDVVEITNLQRQILFDESDVEQGIPKAEAAKSKLARINSQIQVNAFVDDFNHRNAERFVDGVDIILDGLDNFETRYLLNDLAVMRSIPYIYGGAVGTTGVSMPVLPESTPCLRCVFPEAPPPGTSPTCDTAGVLGPVVFIIASHQATQALKILTGNLDAVDRSLLSIDVWTNEMRQFDVSGARENSNCPCCVHKKFEFFEGTSSGSALSLCGRNAVQINPPPRDGFLNLNQVLTNLAAHGTFTSNEFLLRGTFTSERDKNGDPIELTLFPTGRAILKGTTSPDAARSLYAKYIGA